MTLRQGLGVAHNQPHTRRQVGWACFWYLIGQLIDRRTSQVEIACIAPLKNVHSLVFLGQVGTRAGFLTGIQSTTSVRFGFARQKVKQSLLMRVCITCLSVRAIYIFRLRNQKKKEVRSNREMSMESGDTHLNGTVLFPLPGHFPQRFVLILGLPDGPGVLVQNVCRGGVGRYGLCGGTDSPIKVYKAVFKIILGATDTRCQALTSCPSPLPPKIVCLDSMA